ncbi:MAG: RNA polymerase factor sigma-54 [Paludibacteraceae bacterium]|nr:RNA polymerase factor sigma-54 [Paludibacteraceae bacterium]MBR6112350.1 RNA polymerase factor sigma-54 [Paludibacteraceae bacterium]
MSGQSLTIQQQQQLKLSPLQIQVMKLLTQSTLEFNERVEQEIEENPALEVDEGYDYDHDKKSDKDDFGDDDNENLGGDDDNGLDYDDGNNDDFTLGDYVSSDDIPSYQYNDMTEQERRPEMNYQASETVLEDLRAQLNLLPHISEDIKNIALYVIGCLNPKGYLERDTETIVDDFIFIASKVVTEEQVEEAISVVQSLEPAGVGARNIRECLILQLKRIDNPSDAVLLATKILEECYTAIEDKRFDKIQKALGVTEEEIQDAVAELKKLNPQPCYTSDILMDNSVVIVPDFNVHDEDGELVLTLNQANTPTLQLNSHYATVLEEYANNRKNQTRAQKDAALFIKQKVDAAKWFISAVQQRTDTMTKVMTAIIKRQDEFFKTGDDEELKPMIMKTIADDTGFDISTVSRVCNNKYVQTDFGVFPLKHFFTESVETDQGEVHSMAKLKNLFLKCIEEEDKRKPLSDQQIVDYMKEKGFSLARRTIAKYRDQLGIPKAQFRKEI